MIKNWSYYLSLVIALGIVVFGGYIIYATVQSQKVTRLNYPSRNVASVVEKYKTNFNVNSLCMASGAIITEKGIRIDSHYAGSSGYHFDFGDEKDLLSFMVNGGQADCIAKKNQDGKLTSIMNSWKFNGEMNKSNHYEVVTLDYQTNQVVQTNCIHKRVGQENEGWNFSGVEIFKDSSISCITVDNAFCRHLLNSYNEIKKKKKNVGARGCRPDLSEYLLAMGQKADVISDLDAHFRMNGKILSSEYPHELELHLEEKKISSVATSKKLTGDYESLLPLCEQNLKIEKGLQEATRGERDLMPESDLMTSYLPNSR